MRRVLSLVLTVCIIMSILLFGAGAASEDKQNDPGQSLFQLSESTGFNQIESCGEYVRTKLKEHIASFDVIYSNPTDNRPYQEIADAVISNALDYTGISTEGDYLRYGLHGWDINPVEINESEGYYHLKFIPDYIISQEQSDELNQKYIGLENDLDIDSDASDYQKISTIYNYICKNVSYDYDHKEDDEYRIKHSDYSAVINGTSVCQGYTLLLYRLALDAGLEARIISGDGNGESHAWNIVKIDRNWYYLDATWDSMESEYQYFLKGSGHFDDHSADTSILDPNAEYTMSESDYVPAEEEIRDKGLIYRISNGEACVTGYTGRPIEITIPNKVHGYPVVSIEGGAFYECTYLKKVTISKNVEEIQDGAEAHSADVWVVPWESKHGYKMTKPLLYGAFEKCYSLREVEFGAESKLQYIGTAAFDSCEDLKSVKLPSKLERIGPYAFFDCGSLDFLQLPTSLQTIESHALTGTKLSSLEIPASCVSIYPDNIMDDLVEFVVSSKNPVLRSEDGVLYSQFNGIWTLCMYPISKKAPFFEPASSTQYIDSRAFEYGAVGCPEKLNLGGCSIAGNPGLIRCVIQSGLDNKNYITIDDWLLSKDGRIIYQIPSSKEGKVRIPESVQAIAPFASHRGRLEELICGESLQFIGDEAFSRCENLKRIEINGSTYFMGGDHFKGCSVLEEAVLSDDVCFYQDSYGIFQDCVCLKNVTVPKNQTFIPRFCFAGCAALESIQLPDGLKKIESYAFHKCTLLSEITLPDTVLSIGAVAFSDCESLCEIQFPSGLETIGASAFSNCSFPSVDIPESVNNIEDGAFAETPMPVIIGYGGSEAERFASQEGHTFIEKDKDVISGIYTNSIKWSFDPNTGELIIFGDGPIKKTAEEYPWYPYRSAVKEVTIQKGITDIGKAAFSECKRMKKVNLPDTIHIIGGYSFAYCSALESVFIPADAVVAENALLGCSNLQSVEVDPKNGQYYSEDGVLYAEGGKTMLFYPANKQEKTFSVPVGTEKIGEGAFNENRYIEEVVLPDTVIFVDQDAFKNCKNLQRINLNYVAEIRQAALSETDLREITVSEKTRTVSFGLFACCDNLRSVRLSNSVEEIEDLSFDSCKLSSVVIPHSVKRISDQAFLRGTVRDIYYLGTEEEWNNIISEQTVIKYKNIYYIDQIDTCSVQCGNSFAIELSSKLLPNDMKWESCDTEIATVSDGTVYGKNVGSTTVICRASDGTVIAEIPVTVSTNALAKEIGHNLNLSGSIGVNYYLHLSDRVLEDKGAKVHFDLPNGLSSEVLVKDAKVQTVKDVECREFGCKLHSSQMTGTIKAKVILSDGSESEEFPYTVKEYADLIIENPDNKASFTKVTPLIKAMLNYGGYAQQYFEYDDNPLANEDLTADERNAIQEVKKEDVKAYERVVTGSQEGLKYEGSNLMLTSETCIRHFFTVQSGHDISEYTFKLDGKTLTPVKSGKMYYVEIPNIASGNLDTTYTVTAGGITIQYSALSYVYTQLSKENLDLDLANTLKALYLYNQEANAYYKK